MFFFDIDFLLFLCLIAKDAPKICKKYFIINMGLIINRKFVFYDSLNFAKLYFHTSADMSAGNS